MRTWGLLLLLVVVTPASADDVVEPVVVPLAPPPPQPELEWKPRVAFSMGVRVHIARRDDRDNLPETCSAPCSWPSQPVAWSDRSVMFESAFAFGR